MAMEENYGRTWAAWEITLLVLFILSIIIGLVWLNYYYFFRSGYRCFFPRGQSANANLRPRDSASQQARRNVPPGSHADDVEMGDRGELPAYDGHDLNRPPSYDFTGLDISASRSRLPDANVPARDTPWGSPRADTPRPDFPRPGYLGYVPDDEPRAQLGGRIRLGDMGGGGLFDRVRRGL